MKSIMEELRQYRLCGLAIISGALILAGGCTGVQPLPNAARAGDTITLAVGSPENMTKANTSAVFVDSGGGSTAVDIRNIFKVYPDKTSDAWQNDQLLPFIHQTTGHAPWQTLMLIDLPSTLPQGNGSVEITSAATYSNFQHHINDVPIGLEILPGTGQAHEFPNLPSSYNTEPFAGDFSRLEPLPQVVVQPPGSPQGALFGAVEFKLNMAVTNGNGIPADDSLIRVIPDEMITATGTQVLWTRSGDVLTINYINPHGGMPMAALRFSVVPVWNAVIEQNPVPALLSVRYFLANGMETSGPTPTVQVLN